MNTELIRKFKEFISVAFELEETITNSGAGALVATEYPFDQSFDEMCHKMMSWSEAAIRSLKASKLVEGDIIYIAVYDAYEGTAKVLKNEGEILTLELLDIQPCYRCHVIIGGPDEVKYSEIALLQLTDETLKNKIKDIFVKDYDIYPDDNALDDALQNHKAGEEDLFECVEDVIRVRDVTIYDVTERRINKSVPMMAY